MKKLIAIALISAALWQFYPREEVQVLTNADLELMDTPYFNLANSPSTKHSANKHSATPVSAKYVCDSRQYCRQMNSCSEAKFFLQHCPNQKTDGDSDGIPCERQLCGH